MRVGWDARPASSQRTGGPGAASAPGRCHSGRMTGIGNIVCVYAAGTLTVMSLPSPVCRRQRPGRGGCPRTSRGEPHPDQVSLGDGGRRGQAAAPGPLGLDLPAAESHADTLGVPAEDQGAPGIAPEGDQAAQFAGRAAVAQQFRVVDQDDTGPA